MIEPIHIPIPWSSGFVNVWLVRDEPLTLVDTGPNLPDCLAILERGLHALGVRVEDLERIVVTHQHVDHSGAASVLVERSGAQLCAIASLVPWLADYMRSRERDQAYVNLLMERHGVPRDVIDAVDAQDPARNGWEPSVQVDHPLLEGDILEFAHRSWRVWLRPGHSPYDTLFHDEERSDLIAGDHLIAHISSNPLITPVIDQPESERPRTLMTYRDSLRRTRDMDVRTTFAGHGRLIRDHAALIDRRFAGMRRRTERVAHAIGRDLPTAHEVARRIWGDRADTEPHLTLSEVLGHIDLLNAEGRAAEIDVDGTIHLSAS